MSIVQLIIDIQTPLLCTLGVIVYFIKKKRYYLL